MNQLTGTNLLATLDHIDRLAQGYQAVITLSEKIKQIASFEQAATEAEARCERAKLGLQAVEVQMAAKKSDMAEELAQIEQQIVTAKAQLAAITTEANEAQRKADEALAERQAQANELEERVERARATLAALAAGI